jgi:hypothetical protein
MQSSNTKGREPPVAHGTIEPSMDFTEAAHKSFVSFAGGHGII